MPRSLVRDIESVCYALGVPKNAFFAMGAATLAMQFLPLVPGKKRGRLVKDLAKFVRKVADEVEGTL